MLAKIPETEHPFDAELNSELKELEQKVIAAAKGAGLLGLPRLIGDTIIPYFGQFHHEIQQWIHRRAEVFKPETIKHSVITNNQYAESQLTNILNKQNEAETKKDLTTRRLNDTPQPEKWKRLRWVLPVIAAICLFEGLCAIGVFGAWGFNLMESYALALFFAILMGFLAHFIPKTIEWGRTIQQKKIIIAVWVAVLAILYWLMGSERAQHLERLTGNEYHPLPFCLLNLLSMGVATGLSYFYLYHTRSEWREIQAYNKLVKEKKEAEEDYNSITEFVATVRKQKADMEREGATTFETGRMVEQRLISFAYYLLSLYISHNTKSRNDGTPDCFASPEYPFSFVTYFNFKQPEV